MKAIIFLILFAVGQCAFGQIGLVAADSGLYSNNAKIPIYQAYVYSANNANTEFEVRLEAGSFADPGKPPNQTVLRVKGHDYSPSGWA